MPTIWQIAAVLANLAAAIASLALAGWLLPHRKDRAPEAGALAGALVLTACWALLDAGFGSDAPATLALLSLGYLGWLWVLHRLFGKDSRTTSQRSLRAVMLALALVQVFQLALVAAQVDGLGGVAAQPVFARFSITLRLLFCTGSLVLVHNLYVGASAQGREVLRWPAAGLAVIWLYDLNLSTIAYLSGDTPAVLAMFRGVAVLGAVLLFALGASRHRLAQRFSPSRSFAFRSFSLLVIGGYLLVMMLVAQALSYVGTELARLAQFGFLAVAGALAMAVLPSSRLRGWLRVTLSKHLFQHRYDYRAEWLRFTDTMGRAGADAAPLRERIVQAVADITDSPAGMLLVLAEDGGMAPDAHWQWRGVDAPAQAMDAAGARFFEQSRFILDLDDLRQGSVDGIPPAASPQWLLDQHDSWAMVPLLHFERLMGIVVLARPALRRQLDWEDFDLLRVVGRQLASYLAEQASQDALGEAQRFDEFNRRIAFVMHDIKNLTSQLSLLARNAERHADNPDFRADMLVTLRNSAEKLEALLERLGRYRTQGRDAPVPVNLQDVLPAIAARYASLHEVVVVDRAPCAVLADREGLEQALTHLVHNAVEASPPATPVFLDLRRSGGDAVIEVVDSGSGMTREFIRTSLFRPFHSTKSGGFGIGAYEARELVHAMGGRLDVESREGLGTRFQIRLPLATSAAKPAQDAFPEVA